MIAFLFLLQATLGSVRAVDGDTIHDNQRQDRYRLAGWEAPEIGGKEGCAHERQVGEAARAYLQELLDAAEVITAEPAWDPRGAKRWPMNLGRRLAVVKVDGEDVGPLLAARGLAMPRDEERPFDWCEGWP